MKAYFTKLFKYDDYANRVILQTITKANNPEEPVKLLAHLLMAQQVWFNRCKGLPPPAGPLWPDWSADVFEGLVTENATNWLNYLDGLQPGDFDKIISYKNLKGDPFENKLSDILAHVINHGTHHRAQAGQHLKASGIDLPITDYIFYLRQSNH